MPEYGSELLTDRWFAIPDKVLRHPVQKKLALCDKQYIVIAAGRRSFKTERFIKRASVIEAMSNNDKRLFCGAPTHSQAKAIFWNDLQALIPKWAVKEVNKTDRFIKLKNGSELWVLGLDAHQRIEGVIWHWAGITEMQEVSPDFFGTTLEPILNDTGGRGVFEGRPVGKNHFYDLFTMEEKVPELWASFTWTSEGILSDTQIENAKRSLASEDYMREYMASFDVGGQRAYYGLTKENMRVHELIPDLPLIITWDFNATVKPMSVTIGQERADGTYWYKSLSYTYTNTEAMCKLLDQEIETWGFYPRVIYLYGDYNGGKNTSNSSKSDWDHIEMHFNNKARVERFTKNCERVRDRVACTNARICNMLGERRMFIHPDNCRPLIEDYERVQWKSNGVELDQDKDPKRTHNSDSVDYYNHIEFPLRERLIRH